MPPKAPNNDDHPLGIPPKPPNNRKIIWALAAALLIMLILGSLIVWKLGQ